MNCNNLFLIGNGFDRWQGLPTSYEDFRKYYHSHILQILKKLKIKPRVENGKIISPVEMVFGDIFHPQALNDEFFWTLETSMAEIDDQRLNLFFGKTNKGLYQMQETIDQAQEILQTAFGDWIHSITIAPQQTGYQLPPDSYFVNFNYTDTLEKRFGIQNVYHIHGEADDTESIIVGHSTHPEIAFPELIEQKFIHRIGGGKAQRLVGLYLVEAALHETDKGVWNNLDDLCLFMAIDDAHIEDIEDIYVLGLSFSEPDYGYIEYLVKATQTKTELGELSTIRDASKVAESIRDTDTLMDFIHDNILYAQQHREWQLGKKNLPFPQNEIYEQIAFGKTHVYTDKDGIPHDIDDIRIKATEAVHKRFLMEQAASTRETMSELCILKRVKEYPAEIQSIPELAAYIDRNHKKRTRDARWHISYYSDEDRNRIEAVMKKAGCDNYELYQGIDRCIERFAT